MQTTLLGLAIAFIIALIAALVGPYFIDWNQFRPQFEAEAARVVGAPVRVSGSLDARLLPTPSLRLRSVAIGGLNDLGKVRAGKLDVEFSLGSLMRGEWRATELKVNDAALDLGLDAQGRLDWLAPTGRFNLGSLAIDRLNLSGGRVALHDASSRSTIELNDIDFSGDVRSLAGSMRGDGSFNLSGTRYPFRVSSGQLVDGSGTRLHLSVDPGQRPLSIDLDGVLSFDARAPHFDGGIALGRPAVAKANGTSAPMPWRISGKLKAAPGAARIEQLEASYGPGESAMRVSGQADIGLGVSPLLHAVLSARQLDADKLLAKDGAGDNGKQSPNDAAATGSIQLLPALRELVAAIPQAPLKTQIELGAEQIMLAGRPVQNFAADLRADARSWSIDSLEFRAPGGTQVALSGEAKLGEIAVGEPSGSFNGALNVDSSDPDALAAWLKGRSDGKFRGQKPLRLRGYLSLSADRMAIDGMKAELAGGAMEGRVAYLQHAADGSSRLEAALKTDRLDVDAAMALQHSFVGPQAEWPQEGQFSLDIGRLVSAGQELRPVIARLGYGPKTISLDQLKVGDSNGVAVDGSGTLDRIEATGKLAVNATSASTRLITDLIAPFAPVVAGRLNAVASAPGPARFKLAFDLGKDPSHADRASARAVLDVDAPQIKGATTVTATPAIAAMRALDLEAVLHNPIAIESKFSSTQGSSLAALLGVDRAIVAGDGPAQFEGSATGAWRAPLQVKVKLSGAELDASAEGSAEPWGQKAAVELAVRRVNLAPLFDLKPSDAWAKNISLSSHLTLSDGKLTFDDMDGMVAGSRVRGRVALTLGAERSVEGQLGTDTLQLAPAFGVAIGSAGHDAAEPLGAGLLAGWRGQLAFQALRGTLPGGAELRPISGVIRGDGDSLRFDDIKGSLGGGEATAAIEAKPTASGLALNARLELSGVDGAALRYRALAMPAGRTSIKMTLASQGRSASALAGALAGNGLLTLDSWQIAGLDPHAFDAAIRASDSGQATDDNKLRRIVEPQLAGGSLSVASSQIPFTIEDGRLRVGATTLDADGAQAIVSGGYDIAADQTDVRVSLTSTALGSAASHPEIQLFAAGSSAGLDRTVDVASLSSWLAVRAIDRETRRLDSLEHSEAPLAAMAPSASPAAAEVPSDPQAARSAEQPAPKPKVNAARPPAVPQAANTPAVGQQAAPPLPPPIELRPLPSVVRPPKPRPPLALMPPN